MMSLTFGLFTQVSDSGPLGPLVFVLSWVEELAVYLNINSMSFHLSLTH